MSRLSTLEHLESRIAPAAIFVNPTTATYADPDGDHVTLKFTEPVLTQGTFNNILHFTLTGQLQEIDLSSFSPFSFARPLGISVMVRPAPQGDGAASVGEINAPGLPLGVVSIHGDLGQILCGDGTYGLQALSVGSVGLYGTSTGASSAQSSIHGAVGSIVVAGDVLGEISTVLTGSAGRVGSVHLGGSLVGSTSENSGNLLFGPVGSIYVGGDVLGSSMPSTGEIHATSFGSIVIGGSVIGFLNESNGISLGAGGMIAIGGSLAGGSLTFDSASRITIGGSVIGGSAEYTGFLFGNSVDILKIGHDTIGGTSDLEAGLVSVGTVHTLVVGGSIIGGRTAGSEFDGTLQVVNQAGSISLGGSLLGGADLSNNGVSSYNGALTVGTAGSLVIHGSVRGFIDGNGVLNPASIQAYGRGPRPATAHTDLVIGSLVIGGSVQYADVLVGVQRDYVSDDQGELGPVHVGGNWIASNLAVGVGNLGGDDVTGGSGANRDNVNFGTVDDTVTLGRIIPSIASVTIGGQALGATQDYGNIYHFGFVSVLIGQFEVDGHVLARTAAEIQLGDTVPLGASNLTLHDLGIGGQ